MNAGDPDERSFRLFQRTCELPQAERRELLDRECEGEPELRAAVEAMLSHDPGSAAEHLLPPGGALAHADLGLGPQHLAPPPFDIPGYTELRGIGLGSMGIVYQARREEDGRAVAIKLLRSIFLKDWLGSRFAREALALSRLEHPGIARIFETDVAGDGVAAVPYIAMELVHGRALDRYLDQEDPPRRSRLELFFDLCTAVHHAHERGVVHRDLKPANILVTDEGAVKVLDFGLASVADPGADGSGALTRTGQVLGTMQYMSPEQANGRRDEVDRRSDVFSLGVILFEILSGQLPFRVEEGLSLEELRALLASDPVRLGSVDRSLRGELETIAAKALERSPARRYATAAHLAEDLRRHLNGEPIEARPPGALYLLGKLVRRHRTFAAVAASFLLFLMSGLAAALWGLSEAQEGRALANARLADLQLRTDSLRREDLRQRADQLWPAHPRRIPDLQQWLREARELLDRRDAHRALLAALRAGERPRDLRGEDDASWMAAECERHLAALDEFEAPTPGLMADIEGRIEQARQLEQLSLRDEAAAEAWEQAIFEIEMSERYNGLRIEPQVGLLPLGEGVRGLQEFWHPESGERPQRGGAHDDWQVGPETGMVFVLIPGGDFVIGSQNTDPAGPNHDPLLHQYPKYHLEQLERGRLEAYFVAKHEMTQGQWLRLSGHNPSWWSPPGKEGGEGPVSLAHPVERVSWVQAHELLARRGLALPSECQWEFAARGGTDSPWWTGDEARSLEGAANLADRSYGGSFRQVRPIDDWHVDGHAIHAPVGRYAPSPFGLYDVHGNVWEWCADTVLQRGLPTDGRGMREAGDTPTRPHDDGNSGRLGRGGCYDTQAVYARSSARADWSPHTAAPVIGLRAARRLD